MNLAPKVQKLNVKILVFGLLCLGFSLAQAEPRGKSLFDQLYSKDNGQGEIVYQLPKDFPSLLKDINDRLESPETTIGLFYPLGRSLQRYQALPDLRVHELEAKQIEELESLYRWRVTDLLNTDLEPLLAPFFKYPRIVVGYESEPKIGGSQISPLINKRLYFGFNEKSKILEVISYNDVDGRFEFQKVMDFVEGGKKTILYPPRKLCTRCHQNQAPLFARGQWLETNANKDLGFYLQKYLTNNEKPTYFGFPIEVSQDVPQRYDNLTDEASLLPFYQKLWKQVCVTPKCRSLALRFMLEYRLTGYSLDYRKDSQYKVYLGLIEEAWKINLEGKALQVPNPNIVFRDPTDVRVDGLLDYQKDWLLAEFLNLIPPILNPAIVRTEVNPEQIYYEEPGVYEPHDVQKESQKAFIIEGMGKEFFSEEDIQILREKLSETQQSVSEISASWAEEFSSLKTPVFRRREVLRDLGRQLNIPVFNFKRSLGPPQKAEVEISEADILASSSLYGRFQVFRKNCYSCHVTGDGYYATFMDHKTPEKLKENLEVCAPRIWARLNFWKIPKILASRHPSPMPLDGPIKENELRQLKDLIQEILESSELASNKKVVEEGLFRTPPEKIDYSMLPACFSTKEPGNASAH